MYSCKHALQGPKSHFDIIVVFHVFLLFLLCVTFKNNNDNNILVCASSCCVSVKSGSAKLNLKKQFIWKSVVVWKYESANNIENAIVKSLTGDRTAILCGHLLHGKDSPFISQLF